MARRTFDPTALAALAADEKLRYHVIPWRAGFRVVFGPGPHPDSLDDCFAVLAGDPTGYARDLAQMRAEALNAKAGIA